MTDTTDPSARWPIGPGADRGEVFEPRRFVVHWRAGQRVLTNSHGQRTERIPASAATGTDSTTIDLRTTTDLRPPRTWERELGRDVLDRIVFRMLGDVATARDLVDRVVGTTATVHPRRAVTEALALVLEHQGPLGEVRILRIDGVAFSDHRRRLCRELLRWPTAPRVVLALRHLGELDVDEIAAIVDWPADEVRAVAAAWWPEDVTDGSAPLGRHPLRHLDSSTARPRASIGRSGGRLSEHH